MGGSVSRHHDRGQLVAIGVQRQVAQPRDQLEFRFQVADPVIEVSRSVHLFQAVFQVGVRQVEFAAAGGPFFLQVALQAAMEVFGPINAAPQLRLPGRACQRLATDQFPLLPSLHGAALRHVS